MVRRAELVDFLTGIFRKNLKLKALALGLAIALWWFVAGESRVQVGFVVPLEIRNVPAGTSITNKVDRQVEVRFSGPPSLLGTLHQGEISAVIDLSQAKPGRQAVPLDERSVKVPPGVKIQRFYPPAIEIILERMERRRLPVVARFRGGVQTRNRIAKIDIVPSHLEVEATEADFARVKSLSAPLSLPEGETDKITANVRVELMEGHAKIVENPNVRVTVHFRR